MRIHVPRRLLLLSGLLAAISCGESPTGSAAPDPTGGTSTARDGVRLQMVSGGTQVGVAGTALAAPVVIRLLDTRDQPVANAEVEFLVTGSDGAVTPPQARTGADGTAQAVWTLGATAGEQKLRVSGAGGTLVISATAAATPTATVLQKTGGDAQTALAGAELPLPVAVRAVDGGGTPVSNLAVTWTVEGGGAYTASAARTGADGGITARWTLGTGGAQRLTATVAGAPVAVFEAVIAPPAVARVRVEPDSAALVTGDTLRLRAVAYDAQANVLTGRSVAWSTSDAAVAAVSEAGVATGTAAGSAVVSATVDGIEGQARVTVRSPAPAAVARVAVEPDSLTLRQGAEVEIHAVAYDAAGNALTGRAVAWSSSDSLVVKVAGGKVTALATGSATVGATVEGVAGTAVVRVLAPDVAPVARVRVQPDSLALTVGASADLSASALGAAGTPLTGRVVTWSSSDSTVARVGADGRVTALAVGSAAVTATVEGISASARVRVSAPATNPVARVRVQPDSLALTVGASADLSASALGSAGTPLTGRVVAWTTSDSAVARVGADGGVTALAAGSATVTATVEGVSGSARVRVSAPASKPVARVLVQPDSAVIVVGASVELSGSALDAQGGARTGRAVTWSSSDSTVARVGAGGRVTAVAAGSATVTATVEGVTGSAAIRVLAPAPKAVARVGVQLDSLVLAPAATGDLNAVAYDADGNALTGRSVAWSSADASVATVASGGVVTAVATGSTTITATVDGVRGSATVRVSAVAPPPPPPPTPAAVARVVIEPDSVVVAENDTVRLRVNAYDAQGNALTGRGVTWGTSDARVATVASGGAVTAKLAGSARITATVEGISATARVRVVSPVARVRIVPDSATIEVGDQKTFSAVAYDANGNVLTGRAVTWYSAIPAAATVSGGVVTGVGAGNTEIYATVDGVSGRASVQVDRKLPGVVGIRVSTDSLVLDPGEWKFVSAAALTDDGRSSAGYPITWTNSNPAVVTLSSSGVATALAPGRATLTATIRGYSASIGVRVVAIPAAPANGVTIEKITGDGQSAEFGQQLPRQLQVRVLRGGYPLAGAQVTWSATQGGGLTFVAPSTGLTDANGKAVVWWYMGPNVGTQTATARVEGGSSVTFTAEAVRPVDQGAVTSVQMNPGRTWLEPGQSSHVNASALMEGMAARWAVLVVTVDRPDVISITPTPTGLSWSRVTFTALKEGEATITATSRGVSNQIVVKVFPPGYIANLPGGGGGSAIRAPEAP